MDFALIEQKVLGWARDRNILDESSDSNQFKKLVEEHTELYEAIKSRNNGDIKDAIGDMLVVLTSIAWFNHLTLTQCYAHAWNEIKDRKGKMINGLFVKEE